MKTLITMAMLLLASCGKDKEPATPKIKKIHIAPPHIVDPGIRPMQN